MKWIPRILIGSSLVCISGLYATPLSLFSIGAGVFNIVRPNQRFAQLHIEYLWSACWYGLRPIASALVTQKGSLYFCFGAAYEIFLGRRFLLTPSFAPGLYLKNGGKDLGFPIEFRSSISLSYVRDNCDRIGVQFYHLSNASLRRHNPGEESLVFYYGIAF
jgi:lipid A 3-O-deacylase